MPEHVNNERTVEQIIFTRALHLNAVVQGIVSGLVVGLIIFVATNFLLIKGGEQIGPHLALLGQFFIGYRVSFLGSLVGFAYGAVFGYLVGYSVARVYNAIADRRERRRAKA
jgi:hypothetical protein